MKKMIVMAMLLAACGEKKDKATEAKVVATEVKDEVKEKAGEIKDKAGGLLDRAKDLKATAEELKAQAAVKIFDAAGTALRVKSEFDKIYKATGQYDVQISAEGADDAGMKAHEAAIAAMPHISVGDVTVGYEEASEKTLNGVTFSRHFRATWLQNGEKIGLSYYTKEQIDLQAFSRLLGKLVPVVQSMFVQPG